ncbi:MAG: glycoside hydrolase family 25 protein [Clostridia bacterium]|nr:glycoside hydrolase family 25 protein [Clostridia bacterium]
MKSKVLVVFLLILFILIAPYLIVQHVEPLSTAQGSNASYSSYLSQSAHASQSSQPQSSHQSVGAFSSSSKSSQLLSEAQPLLSLEPRLSGMYANGMISLRIIDVSHSTTINDWSLVKKNVDGIYMKATEGTTFTDPSFATFAKSAIKAQIPIGFYHYFWPSSNPKYAKQQADYFYKTIKSYKYQFHPVLDVEITNDQNAKTITEDVKIFSEEFSRLSKQKIMIYCSPNFANHYLNDKSLTQYPLWIANYQVNDPSLTMIWSTFDVWQYGSIISIPGISGDVDGDIATNNIFLDINSAPKS